MTEAAVSAPAPLATLLSAKEARLRSRDVLAAVEAGDGLAFRLDRSRLDAAAKRVADVTRAAYPDLNVPPHSRWRHFVTPDGIDRWRRTADVVLRDSHPKRIEAEIDLAFVSVLLDAGAGTGWRYRAADGSVFGRSEGLAAASLDMFFKGAFCDYPSQPLSAGSVGLTTINPQFLAEAMQSGATAETAVVGIEGRCALLHALADAMEAAPEVFGGPAIRPGHLYHWAIRTGADAPRLLTELLTRLGPIWPQGLTVDGVALGDCWRHPAVKRDGPTDGLIPFHKLTQWLVYSLAEPFANVGHPLGNLDELTGLAEYRNGGLFVDMGVIEAIDAEAASKTYEPGDPLVVEWRALTLALLDDLAPMVRAELNAPDLSLAAILQGGTWAAGRQLAAERRPGAAPPFAIKSDGTLF